MVCELVIFDCDGVLVDTEPMANAVMAKTLSELGLVLSVEDCRNRFMGRSIKPVQGEVEAEIGRTLGSAWPDQVREALEDEFRRQGVEAIPGVRSVVENLRASGIAYCVASSGRVPKMRVSLGQAGLLPYFEDVLYSADMVAQGKPAPDVFLHAADAMGAAPENAVVIEDSLPGVQAGVRAGMRVFAYTGDHFTNAEELRQAGGETFDDMRQLVDVLQLLPDG